MNKLQSGTPRHGQILTMSEMKERATTSICVVALELPRLVAPDVHHFTHEKEMLLLPDSNYITWAPSIPGCLLSRRPVSRLGILQTLQSKIKELHNFPSQSPSALSRVPTTLAFFNGILRNVEPVCFPASHRSLSHTKPCGVSCGDCSYRR